MEAMLYYYDFELFYYDGGNEYYDDQHARTLEPTLGPTSEPSLEPTTKDPTSVPTLEPSLAPTKEPTGNSDQQVYSVEMEFSVDGVTDDNWDEMQAPFNEGLAEQFGRNVSDISSTFVSDGGRRILSAGKIEVEIKAASSDDATSLVSDIEDIPQDDILSTVATKISDAGVAGVTMKEMSEPEAVSQPDCNETCPDNYSRDMRAFMEAGSGGYDGICANDDWQYCYLCDYGEQYQNWDMQPCYETVSSETSSPTMEPTLNPSKEPTKDPSCVPTMQPSQSPVVDCCSLLQMSGFPDGVQSNRDGTFTKLDGISQEGFPVYQNDDGSYLYLIHGHRWVIGEDYTTTSVGVLSQDGVSGCPDVHKEWSLVVLVDGEGAFVTYESVTSACCGNWCYSKQLPWTTKCAWGGCSGCTDCVDVNLCPSWCVEDLTNLPVTCSWAGCKQCDLCQGVDLCANWCAQKNARMGKEMPLESLRRVRRMLVYLVPVQPQEHGIYLTPWMESERNKVLVTARINITATEL